MEVYVIADVSMFERLTDRVDRIRILKRKTRTSSFFLFFFTICIVVNPSIVFKIFRFLSLQSLK